MKSKLLHVLIWGTILLVVSSCATVPTEPLAPGEVRLLVVHVPEVESLRANLQYGVYLNFEADGKPEITRACFRWSGAGPYCYKVTDVSYGSPGAIRVQVRTPDMGSYNLEGYVLYVKDGNTRISNIVNSQVSVAR